VKPAYGVGSLAGQDVRQLIVAAVLGYPVHVRHEVVFGVGWQLGPGQLLLGNVIEDGAEIFDVAEGRAKCPSGKVGVSADPGRWSFLEHQDAPNPLAGGKRRAEGRISGARNDHIVPLLHETLPKYPRSIHKGTSR
jgi:hypothetical protein